MYRRILAATDGSPTSELALAQAIGLAHDSGAALRIAHVLDYGPVEWAMAGGYALDVTPMIDAMRDSGRKTLEQAAALAHDNGVVAETALFDQPSAALRVAETLADEARRWDADQIVLGTHGRRGFSHLLIGSVAESVLRLADVPVLLVRGTPGAAPASR
jgi:nucleotide-binding universal stress UspA family protein